MSETGLWGAPQPLAARLRPANLDEIVGQSAALSPGGPLRQLADPTFAGAASSVILWGPPGTGKTTLASVIARSSGRTFMELSAVTAGVKDVRDALERARRDGELSSRAPVLFLDEIHRFSKAQQDALLPGVENGLVVLIAATTENPSFSVISPLLSRSLLVTLSSLEPDDIDTVIDRALESPQGFEGQVGILDEARSDLVRLSGGDARKALTALEAAVAVARSRSADDLVVAPEDVEQALNSAPVRYDRQGDQHYDVISAFIKSVRGSDADAALHYLARMIEAGEDPRFIARRLIVLAAEDIGLADPPALGMAVSAAQAVALIGMPEGRIPLAEATIYLALAPKSNAAYVAIQEAQQALRDGKVGEIPPAVRDAHYPGAKTQGNGLSYRYPHDSAVGVVHQVYAPEPVRGDTYYRPSGHGFEKELEARREAIARILRAP